MKFINNFFNDLISENSKSNHHDLNSLPNGMFQMSENFINKKYTFMIYSWNFNFTC